MSTPPEATTDPLREAIAQGGFSREDFGEAVVAWLWAQFMADRWARLDQAQVPDAQKTRLAQVFTDIASDRSENELAERLSTCATSTVSMSGVWERQLRSRRATGDDAPLISLQWGSKGWGTRYVRPSLPRASDVLIGGPGQGKTTLTQMLAQCHRAALLESADAPEPSLRAALAEFNHDLGEAGIPAPGRKLLPVRVDLARYAAFRARGWRSLDSYLAHTIASSWHGHFWPSDVVQLLRRTPWLAIFDGLDEVPAGGGRREVIDDIVRFLAQQEGATGAVIVTTRPQGYLGGFGDVPHRQIASLDAERAERYARRLVAARYADRPEERDVVLERLLESLQDGSTARLLQTPLQVTIMATLVAQIGQAPRERWRLFSEYYRAVYSRETAKGGEIGRLLGGNREHIDAIHRQAGLLLQVTSEHEGRTDATLSTTGLREVAQAHLEGEGYPAERAALLAEQIVGAALDRLVFLVELQQGGRLGFEIRSLQEYMAAWALTTGGDAPVLDRLRAIAPYSYWRNTYVLAVGGLFDGGATTLRDAATIDVCRALDAEAGRELALDLLDDKTILSRPKVPDALIDFVLSNLDAIPNAPRYLHVLAGEPLNADFRAVERFREAARRGVETAGPAAIGAWRALLALTVAEDPEGVALVRAHWPQARRDAVWLAREIDVLEAWEHERSGEEGVRLAIDLLDVPPWLDLIETEPPELIEATFRALEPREYRPWPAPLGASPLADYAVWLRLGLPDPPPRVGPDPAPDADDSPVLRKVILRGVRAHVDVTFTLPSPAPDRGQCVLVLGENGSGKTTLLRALAFALLDPTIADGALQQSASRYCNLSGDATVADCMVETDRGVFHTELATRNGLEIARARSPRTGRRPFVLGYGCRRGSAMGSPDRDPTATPFDDVSTLFDRPGSLVHSEAWLRNLHGGGNGDLDLYHAVIAVLLRALPGVTAMSFVDGRLRVSGPAVGDVDFAALSDGYLTTAGLVVDIVYRWKLRAARLGQKLGRGFIERMTGVVLVDEIDLHLHPVWQMRVLDDLRAAFPRMTFVGTTHNPLTLVGARSVVVLSRGESGVAARVLDEDARLMTASQIYRSFFGIAELYPDALGEQLRRYGLLAGDPSRTDAQDTELELLRAELRRQGADPGWEPVAREEPTAEAR